MTTSFKDFFLVFLRIGVLSFGGPAAQISLMQSELVEKHKWLDRDDFLRALSFCMLLPGPEAMQLATYAGWRMRGVLGGLIAGMLFVIPGAIVILGLAFLYLSYGHITVIQHAFLGVQAAVIVIVIGALLKLVSKALNNTVDYVLALASFVAIFVFAIPFPIVIAGAAMVGVLVKSKSTPVASTTHSPNIPYGTLGTLIILWALPIILCLMTGQEFLTDVGLFFSKLAVVTFGGAYAVLSYMTQAMVQDYGWISTEQMVTALGMAETTPGPLILVTEFTAILAGAQNGGWDMALAAGAMALWVTFIPCFIWIFAGAPILERLMNVPAIAAALSAITAAVVGVIFNLSLWFAIHVFFGDVGRINLFVAEIIWPQLTSVVWPLVAIFVLALSLSFWRKWSIFAVLSVAMVTAILAGMVGISF